MAGTKTQYQTDDQGYLIGSVVVHENQRRPGTYLEVPGAIDEAPPALTTGQGARRVDGAWVVVDPDPVVVPDPPTIAELKTAKQDALAAKRWLVEYSGFTISGGLLDGTFVDTSAKTRMVFDTAHRRATENPLYEIRAFKSGRGAFAMMNAATIILIGDAIEEFIQQCFEHESNLNDLVVAAVDQAGLDAIDIDAGWPT
ncbi:DUF4376 domain-containing protein [Roseobacter sp. YSTF-M11]|uniref:DUF4376 domain-containing protein n=1 Tax=Roseobacter insulae TaxID=2859783 RepID=A0A9X1K5D8_9RHOB|nr:DUF4376 domain-containing protein [Roseobacter insulae]MBW4710742.1 DUF4376 domain-containing protein [Roseobacter insulae]